MCCNSEKLSLFGKGQGIGLTDIQTTSASAQRNSIGRLSGPGQGGIPTVNNTYTWWPSGGGPGGGQLGCFRCQNKVETILADGTIDVDCVDWNTLIRRPVEECVKVGGLKPPIP